MAKKSTPAAPPDHKLPQAGGSWIRQADGSLVRAIEDETTPPNPPETPVEPALNEAQNGH